VKTRGHAVCSRRAGWRRNERGFSLVELLVACVLAGIVFLAMVPMFVGAMKATSTNSRRVVATGIAQARVEKIRMLGAVPTPTATTGPTGYACITTANMNSSSFDTGIGAGGFSTSYPAPAGGKPYTVNTTVSTDDPKAPYKTVVVTVSRSGDPYSTKVTTVIDNPTAIIVTSTSGPQNVNNPHSLTVSSTKQWQEIKNVKVTYINTASPTVTLTPTPGTMTPNASATSCVFTNLPGGPSYTYTVTVTPQSPSSWGSPLTAPLFHLLSDDFKKFDTNPGGS
jgi:prepilin-type N-terminal cleavage/methylation domain-containing protein